MTRVDAPIEHSFKVDVRRHGYNPPTWKIRIRNVGPFVEMDFGPHRIQLRTKTAWHLLGWPLYRAGDECTLQKYDGKRWMGEDGIGFVVLTINGSEIHLDADAARKVAVSLWRRSDAVDDYQIAHKVRIVS